MSDNFPNIKQNATEQSMNVGMQDPNGMQAPNQSAGGKTKVNPTQMDGMQSMSAVEGYGYMSPDLKNVGMAPSGENSSGIPAAQPIPIMTFGDPNDTGLDFRDGADKNSVTVKGGDKGDIAGYDIRKPNPMN